MAGSEYSDRCVDDDDVSNLTAIGLSDVHCPTSNYLHLLRCSFQIGPDHNCTDGEGYTMLECNSNRIWEPPYVGEIRLVGSNYSSQGWAQIYCGEAGWGRICSSLPFNQREADTVCRQLGYTHAAKYNHLSNIIMNNSLPLLLNNVRCSKKEDCLGACAVCYQSVLYCYTYLTIECEFNTLHYGSGSDVSTCEYIEGGYIEARPRLGEVRMSSRGVAEVFHNISGNRTWSSICTSGEGGVANTNRVANTFCTQYGYNRVIKYSSVSVDNGNTPPLSILCDIEHPHLLWCSVSVATTCSSILLVSCKNEFDYYAGQLRLKDGDYPSEGRVEMYVYGDWSSIYFVYNPYVTVICDEANHQYEADIICRQLGYTGADFYSVGTLPGSGYIRISLSFEGCDGVIQCFSQWLTEYRFILNVRNISHAYDLAVNCTFNISQSYSAGFYGSRTDCSITEPRDSSNNINIGGILLGVFTFVGMCCLIYCFITFVICVAVCVTKRDNRRAKAARRAAGQVGYNPQMGAQVGYNPQALGRNTQQTTATGEGQNSAESEGKVPPPPYSNEVSPSVSN